MADHHHDDSDLPSTWPFRVAGTLLIAALSWFCLGFALEDVEYHLTSHFSVFYALIGISIALCLLGAVVNFRRERARKSH
jgi:hypothetical protein